MSNNQTKKLGKMWRRNQLERNKINAHVHGFYKKKKIMSMLGKSHQYHPGTNGREVHPK